MKELKIGRRYYVEDYALPFHKNSDGTLLCNWRKGDIIKIRSRRPDTKTDIHRYLTETNSKHTGSNELFPEFYVLKLLPEVGDKVRIINNTVIPYTTSTIEPQYVELFSEEMLLETYNKIGEVTYLNDFYGYYVKIINEEDEEVGYNYLPEWLEVVEDNEETSMNIKDFVKNHPEAVEKLISEDVDFRITHKPEYKGNYKLIIYFTNGKEYRVNHVNSYDYTPEEHWLGHNFSYTMKDIGNTSFVKMETFDMEIASIAGFAVKDNHTGQWLVQPIKPCWYEKHSFHVGKEA